MQSLDLEQYWPNTNRPLPSSGLADGIRAVQEPQHIQSSDAVRDRHTPVLWGGLGFLAGMFVWHMVGFWTFISHVAFNGDHRVTTAAGSPAKPAHERKHALKPAGNTQVSSENCITLAIDRTSGAASPEPCPAITTPLADAGRTRRDDLAFTRPRLQDPQIWAGVTAVESEVATGTLDEADFDLTIRPGP